MAEIKPEQASLQRITGRSPATPPAVVRYGRAAADGIDLYVDAAGAEEVVCDARKLGLRGDTLVFDEFAQRVLPGRRSGGNLTFRTSAGPALVQLGSKVTLVRGLLARIEESLQEQSRQRKMDRELGTPFVHRAWAGFCQGWTADNTVARSGKVSLKATGGAYTNDAPMEIRQPAGRGAEPLSSTRRRRRRSC